MRGSSLAQGLVLATALAGADVRAAEAPAHPSPAFRLLELGGQKARWAGPDAGRPVTIRYAFLTEPAEFPGAHNCDAMLPPDAALQPSGIDLSDFRGEVRAAFSTWEAAANIRFVETPSVADAGILIGADAKARGRAFTNVALADGAAGARATGVGAIRQSLICLNPRRPWKIGFDGNLDVYDLRFTITHEIGHAIGLDHPSPEGQLMSFRYVEHARGLQPGDVAGAVALYGASGTIPTVEAGAGPASADRSRAPERVAPNDAALFGLGEPARPQAAH